MREYGLTNEPRLLLEQVQGIELVELPDSKTCCGLVVLFRQNTQQFRATGRTKVRHALSTGAKYITSTEASCLMNIAGYISKNNYLLHQYILLIF